MLHLSLDSYILNVCCVWSSLFSKGNGLRFQCATFVFGWLHLEYVVMFVQVCLAKVVI